jgi:hypothetical protein
MEWILGEVLALGIGLGLGWLICDPLSRWLDE